MWKKVCCLVTGMLMLSGTVAAVEGKGDANMKIKLTINNNQEVIVLMKDNYAVTQFINMLPAELEFRDFAGEEKITEFPKPVDLDGVPRGMIASAGKMFIYAPWGNLGFFYKNHGTTIDKSLIELGEVESGLNYMAQYKAGFKARIEVLDD